MISSVADDREVEEGAEARSIHDSVRHVSWHSTDRYREVFQGRWIVPSERCLEDEAIWREGVMAWSWWCVSSAPIVCLPARGGR
jgi:hypothetical protein